MSHIQRAIDIVGGTGELARAVAVSQQVVCNWRSRARVPPDRCLALEEATDGKVTRYELRPDIFGPSPKRRAA